MPNLSTKNESDYIKFIQNTIKKYQDILKLNAYEINVIKNNEYYYGCQFRYPYRDNSIYWSDKSFKDWTSDREDINHERCILHEVCHILTDPIYAVSRARFVSKEEIEDRREDLTDHLSLIVFDLVNKK